MKTLVTICGVLLLAASLFAQDSGETSTPASGIPLPGLSVRLTRDMDLSDVSSAIPDASFDIAIEAPEAADERWYTELSSGSYDYTLYVDFTADHLSAASIVPGNEATLSWFAALIASLPEGTDHKTIGEEGDEMTVEMWSTADMRIMRFLQPDILSGEQFYSYDFSWK